MRLPLLRRASLIMQHRKDYSLLVDGCGSKEMRNTLSELEARMIQQFPHSAAIQKKEL